MTAHCAIRRKISGLLDFVEGRFRSGGNVGLSARAFGGREPNCEIDFFAARARSTRNAAEA